MNKPNVLFILGSGGHTAQMIELSKELKKKINYIYIIQKGDTLSKSKIIYPGKIIYVTRPREIQESYIVSFFKTTKLFFKALDIINRNKITSIITAGPGIAIPFCYTGKMLGKKIIFIESWSRVTKKSISGKLIYPISDLFFVQWKENLINYPKAKYCGRLK
ncbi:MAG TPA: PssD/Cps14F family polysaccharide biosynthesis glycosyltransferase [archaeon]|nr:PssD/Cps14F family polysaccharide biosynthesis glycosyltransferase [archaeon]